MDFRCIPDVLPAALGDFDGDCLAVGLFAAAEDRPDHPQLEQLTPPALGQSLTSRLEQRRFKAKPGECLSLDRLDASPQTLILVGLGAPADFNLAGLRRACAAASQAAAAAGASHLALAMPIEALAAGAAAQAMAEASRLALFSDQRFKGEPEPRSLPETISLIGVAASAAPALAAVAASCAGVELARELVAAPTQRGHAPAPGRHRRCHLPRLWPGADGAGAQRLRGPGYGLLPGGGPRAQTWPPSSSTSPTAPRVWLGGAWCWWARASPSIPAATTSRPPAPRSR